jgi:accessory colonization factor AcfC
VISLIKYMLSNINKNYVIYYLIKIVIRKNPYVKNYMDWITDELAKKILTWYNQVEFKFL